MAEVWRRFFAIVLLALLLLLASGALLYRQRAPAPLGWTVMLALGLLMTLLFAHIYGLGWRRFRRAVAAAQWPVAARAAAQIQRLVWANFALGWLAVIALRMLS